MELTLSVDDMATPLLEDIINNKPQWFGRALKSAGWQAQKLIKAGIKSGAPGGMPYPTRMTARRRREIDDGMASGYTRRRPLRSYPVLGKLRNAVGYDKTKADQGIVTVGWLSNSAVRLGTWIEKGVTQTVSAKMRRMFMAAGIGLTKGRTSVVLIAYKTYIPMLPVIQSNASNWINEKLKSYLDGNDSRSTSSRRRRKYKVYR